MCDLTDKLINRKAINMGFSLYVNPDFMALNYG